MHACMCVCVCVGVRGCMRACVHVYVCESEEEVLMYVPDGELLYLSV